MNKVMEAIGGTVSGYSYEEGTVNGKRFAYNGTIRGLEASAIAAGAVAGDVVTAHLVFGPRQYVLEFNEHITHNALKVQAARIFKKC